MHLRELQPGDVVYAARTLTNDGSHPGLEDGAVIAEAGARGVLINVGHLEENPNQEIYLVRFEGPEPDRVLGPPIGCWPEELTATANPQAS